MYYKEKIIDGVLCFKDTLHGEWRPLTNEAYTKKIMRLQVDLEVATARLEKASRKLHEKI